VADKIRRQKPLRGERRERLTPYVIKEIEHAVQREADRHGVTPSFVVCVRLAASYGIKRQEQY